MEIRLSHHPDVRRDRVSLGDGRTFQYSLVHYYMKIVKNAREIQEICLQYKRVLLDSFIYCSISG